jgi:thiosulfate/3-mercaptopyruvate sulfurtransferase
VTPLISPEELLDRLDGITVLDVRWQLGRDDGREQHLAGHVPGAAYVDLAHDLADPDATTGGRHPLPRPGVFTEAMRRVGVRRDRAVVVYDDVRGTAAARAWWLLRHHGHPAVQLLDGGWSAWVAVGGPKETGVVAAPRGDFDGRPGHLPTVDAAAAAAVSREGVLLDARAPARYRGDTEPVDPVAGHVPGALNVPTERNSVPSGPRAGRFLAPGRLAEVYAAVSGRSGEVAVYCGSGVTATHDILALELLGVRAALYPGSWSEWVSDPRRPVATGDETPQRPGVTSAPRG